MRMVKIGQSFINLERISYAVLVTETPEVEIVMYIDNCTHPISAVGDEGSQIYRLLRSVCTW